MTDDLVPEDYQTFIADIKGRIRTAQVRAALSVNRELIELYWQIGSDITRRQQEQDWGGGVIERLAKDLASAFPGVKGFSARNLWRMRAFAQAYPGFLPPVVAEIPWAHNVILLEKLKEPDQRLWYAEQAIQHGWSRNVLALQIETHLLERQGSALTNFSRTLPTPQSDLAQQILKDPYQFDFLTLKQDAQERDLERGLLEHLRHFLLELGVGFAFVGSQYHLEVGQQDFYIDLLFYHMRLRCFIVIDLKMRAFTPEDAGKMSFYLSVVDDRLRHRDDQPSIGLILCRTRDRVIAEYALRDSVKPMGISTFHLHGALPEPLKGALPTIEELETELQTFEGVETGENG